MKTFAFFVLLQLSVYAAIMHEPQQQYIASGPVVDFIVHKERVYSATNASYIDVFDLRTGKVIEKIALNKITDFMGEKVDSKVYSVDLLEGKLLVLSQAEEGYRRVQLYFDHQLHELITAKEKLYIAKAKFLDGNTLLLALLSNQIISFDIAQKKINWNVQVSQSKFSDFALNEQKDKVLIADESGDLKMYTTKKGLFLETFSGQNLDNVFQVVYQNGIIATAGQDRRTVVYDALHGSAYYVVSSFLIYSVGISPSGKRVAYASDENNNVTLFDTASKSVLGRFTGNKMTLTKIVFLNEDEFLVSSDDRRINRYHLGRK